VAGGLPRLKPRVLVVDDDPTSRYVVEHDLLGLGAEVLVAGDGRSGLQQLVDNVLDLDLLVTDLDMPGIDGLALVRMVRAEGGEGDLPILVVSGWLTPESRAALNALGAAVLDKGEGANAIAEAARRLLSARGWSFSEGRAVKR
jgi:CheY-like chemotaxis protein